MRSRVYVTIRCPASVCMSQHWPTAAATNPPLQVCCCGPGGRKYRSTAARRSAAAVNECGHCRVDSRRRKLRTDLFQLLVGWSSSFHTGTVSASPACRGTYYSGSFRRCAPAFWNSLPKTVPSSDSAAVFKSRLKTFFSSRLSLLSLLTNTLPGPSASEVTTLWRYTNLLIIIIIIIIYLSRATA